MEVHVSLVGRKDLSGEIYRQLRRAILDGRLRPGDSLPPSRELARSLSVSRNTVSVAYDRLWGEGFVESRMGSGTFVSGSSPQPTATDEADTTASLRPLPGWETVPLPSVFGPRAEFDFRTGLPDASLFPYEKWRSLLSAAMRFETLERGVYSHPAGYAPLRRAIARHIGISRGVQTVADNVVIANGTQQALDLIARILLRPGDTVAVEDPGYSPPRLLFQSLGLKVVGVPVDEQGLVVEALPDDARLVYVTPSHEWPLGVSTSLARRWALLEWASEHKAAIIEDDYDSEFRFGGRPLEPLQTIDTSGRVIYIGSFSKTLLPVLRLGFIVAPPALGGALQRAKFIMDWHSSLPVQVALAGFIEDGGFARHLRRMRSIYERRHDLIRTVLSRDFEDQLQVIPSSAGLHLTAIARPAYADRIPSIQRAALERGVAIQSLATFTYDVPGRAGIMLGYGAIATDQVEEGLHRLRAAFDA
jgi:GntR family transcriptional regulator/MocR family aminotransferase